MKGLIVPQAKPLSPGEVLGCTSPKLNPDDFQAIVYVISSFVFIVVYSLNITVIWEMDDFT